MGPTCKTFSGTTNSDPSNPTSTESANKNRTEPEKVETAIRGLLWVCKTLREDVREGNWKEDSRVKREGFERFRARISRREASEMESETARMMKRSKTERGGSHRTASMYLDWGMR